MDRDVIGFVCMVACTLSSLSIVWTGRDRLQVSTKVLLVTVAMYFCRIAVRYADNAWDIGATGVLAQSDGVVNTNNALMAAAFVLVAWESWRGRA